VELVARIDGRGVLLQQGHDLFHQRKLLLLPLRLGQCRQGDLAQLAQVAGQARGGFGGVEWLQVLERCHLGEKDLVAGFTEGVVVEAGWEDLPGHGLVTRYRVSLSCSNGANVNTTLM
jgi:hypothetical protein